MADKNKRLFRIVQDRAMSKKEAEEEKKKREQNLIPYLPEDCASDILIRLPLESLQRSRFVCKPWYKIINAPKFVDAHLNRSETTIIFLTHTARQYELPSAENPNAFSVERKFFEIESLPIFIQPLFYQSSKYAIRYMEVRDGRSKIVDYNATCLGRIRASCNGLILLDNKLKSGGLIGLNPVTRKMIVLPLGTLYPSHKESYALAFCNTMNRFKLVHLFRDESMHINCEILDIGSRSWRVIDGPSFGLLGWFGYNPVQAIGGLHWVPHINRSEYLVSLSIEEEKFNTIELPTSSRTRDGIIEIGGLLGFVTRVEMNQIDVWVLQSLSGGGWMKQHSINVSQFSPFCFDIVPLCCTKVNGEIIFMSNKGSSIYTYNIQSRVMEKIKMGKNLFPFHVCFLPHVNSLVSWQAHGGGETVD